MTAKLEKIFSAGTNLDLTKEVIELKERVPEIYICSGTYAMLEDANKNKTKIFKIKSPIKSNEEIPMFKFI